MQSVISCLLAIKRIMCERKVIPKHNLTAQQKNGSTRNLLLFVDEPRREASVENFMSHIPAPSSKKIPTTTDWPMKLSSHRRSEPKKYFHTERAKKSVMQKGGYVKSQVQIITTSNNQLSVKENTPARRLSSDYSIPKEPLPEKQKVKLPLIPKPSKSSPIVMVPKEFSDAAKNNTANAADYKRSSSEYVNMEYTNRKTSLKKMGACAIKVECDDGSIAVYVSDYQCIYVSID